MSGLWLIKGAIYVNSVEAVKRVSDELDKEAVKVIENMPRWKPGLQDGEPVRVEYSLPIQFEFK